MAKTSFNLKDPATFVGFILGLLATALFNVLGLIILIVVVLFYYFTNKKNVMPALIGALVGIVIGIVINIIVGGVIALF